jgi:histone deacetylase 1/2
MENSNSREYLDKITAAVIDNLRQTGPAPSVQMQDVPRKPFGGMTDEEEAELDDLDEDENKDIRMTEHRWDKHVENGAEFEPSDDDELAAANGATRSNGNKRAFNDFKNPDIEEDRPSKSPKEKEDEINQENAEAETHDVNDDTIEDVVAAAEQQETETVSEEKGSQGAEEAEKEKVDADGDVGMADSTVTEETNIKKEEGEPEPVPEPDKDSNKAVVEEPAEVEREKSAKVDEEPAAEEKADKPVEKEEAEAAKPTETETEPEAEAEAEAEAGTGAEAEAEAMEVDDKEKVEDKQEDDSSK